MQHTNLQQTPEEKMENKRKRRDNHINSLVLVENKTNQYKKYLVWEHGIYYRSFKRQLDVSYSNMDHPALPRDTAAAKEVEKLNCSIRCLPYTSSEFVEG